MSVFKLVVIAGSILVCGSIDARPQQAVPSATNCATGIARIDAREPRPAVVSLNLARGAVTIVEFPADDGVHYLYEGNSRFAAVFDSPTRASDRSVTIYPGAEFRYRAGDVPTAASTVTMQMKSGLVVVLELSAVGDLRRNSNRCVLSYSTIEAATARNEMGLGPISNTSLPKADTLVVGPQKLTGKPLPEDPREDWAEDARKLIDTCLRSAFASCAEEWTIPHNAFSIGASRPVDLGDDRRMVIVGVRNISDAPMFLAPGFPSLRLETPDPKGKIVETIALKTEQVFVLFPEAAIPAKGTAYFAMVYRAPVAGVRQRLAVIAASRDAADDPASVSIPR